MSKATTTADTRETVLTGELVREVVRLYGLKIVALMEEQLMRVPLRDAPHYHVWYIHCTYDVPQHNSRLSAVCARSRLLSSDR
jgi:hypothetical protein